MNDNRKILGILPIHVGDWSLDKTPYSYLNNVYYLGCTFQSKIDNNNSIPCTIDSSGQIVINDNWQPIAVGSNGGIDGSKLNKVINDVNDINNKFAIEFNNVDNTSDINKPVSTLQAQAIQSVAETLNKTTSDLTAHKGNLNNPHKVSKEDLNIGNIDNTSDLDKPISTATKAALDNKVEKSLIGSRNGLATLDSNGVVPTSQLNPAIISGKSYKGSWDASTNTPNLTSVPASGFYYIVSKAGNQFNTDWNVDDTIISNGTAWEKITSTASILDGKIVQLEQKVIALESGTELYNSANNEIGGIEANGSDNDKADQSRTCYMDLTYVSSLVISGTTRLLSTMFYDKNKSFVESVADTALGDPFTIKVPSGAYYARRVVKTTSHNDVASLSIMTDSTLDKVITSEEKIKVLETEVNKLTTDAKYVNLFNIKEIEDGLINAETGENISVQEATKRTLYIPVTPSSRLTIKNYNRKLSTACYRKDKTFLKSFADTDGVTSFVLPTEAYYIRRVVQTSSSALDTNLSITQGEQIEFDFTAKSHPANYAVIKPENFEGANIGAKVKAANDYIIKSGVPCELLLKDTAVYLINESIILPTNSKLTIDGCTLKLADSVFDNVIRSANIIPNQATPYEYVERLDKAQCIKIVGLNGAKIEGADVLYRATNPKTGVIEDWVGDYWGWRAFIILMSNVNTFDISGFSLSKNHSWCIVATNGCCNGAIHDIDYNSTRRNGDGIDFVNGVHNMSIYNITGSSQDDTVAFATFDNSRWRHDGYVYPLTPVPYEDYTYGDTVTDVSINNVHATGTNHIFILLSNFATIENISLSNIGDIAGSNKAAVIKIYGGEYGKNYKDGIIRNITANNVTNNNCPNTVHILGRPHNSWFNNIKTKTGKQVLYNPSDLDLSVLKISNSTFF